MQQCRFCKETVGQYIIQSRYPLANGDMCIKYACHPCNRARTKKYYHANKERFRAIIYKSIEKHKEKQTARVALKAALNKGFMVRPDTCSVCNTPCKPHGHHDDYTKPLDVRWLCVSCHADAHPEHRIKR